MKKAMSELSKRIWVAVIAIPIAIIIFYLGGWIFNFAIAIISSIAIWEFSNLANKKDFPTYNGLLIFANISIILISTEIQLKVTGIDIQTLAFILLVLLYLIILLVFILGLTSNHQNTLATIGTFFTTFCYVILPFFCLIIIRNMVLNENFSNRPIENSGLYLLIIIFCSIWFCDSMAFFVGRKIGKHKLMPKVSPKKSVEGAIAGFIAASALFPILSYFLMPNFNLHYALICGIIVGIFGQIGDLIESKFKRDANVKDSSNIIPGHGGILDRFDSIIFAAPLITFFILIVTNFI
jgi:phosphatidate cytidylyltransferase